MRFVRGDVRRLDIAFERELGDEFPLEELRVPEDRGERLVAARDDFVWDTILYTVLYTNKKICMWTLRIC
jgi:hypothetical protein